MYGWWMRRTLVCLLLVASTVTAAAQPGNTVPAPHTYQPPPPPLSPEELRILEDGPVSDGAHVVGVGAALFVGFGTGQAIQGRWLERGWIFTVGEIGSYILILSSIPHFGSDDRCDADCNDDDSAVQRLWFGAIAWLGFRIWGFSDSISGPIEKNRRYRKVRAKLGFPHGQYAASPYFLPAARGDGATAGVTFRF